MALWLAYFIFWHHDLLGFEVLQVGDQKILEKTDSYHFSSKELISFDSRGPSLIAKHPGHLTYRLKNKKHNIYILSPKQMIFLQKTKDLIFTHPKLEMGFEKDILTIAGSINYWEELNYLLSACKDSRETKFNLSFKNPHNIKDKLLEHFSVRSKVSNKALILIDESPALACLNLKKTKNIFEITLALISKNKSKSFSAGLGIISRLPWQVLPKPKLLNYEAEFGIDQFNSKNLSLFYLTGNISKNSPLQFESGQEFGIRIQRGFSNQVQWKKALNSIKIELLQNLKGSLLLSFEIISSRRQPKALSISRTSSNQSKRVLLGQWEPLFHIRETTNSKSKDGIPSIDFLGTSQKNNALSSNHIFVKANKL